MNARETNPKRILVIKLGALGDVVQALGPMSAIRKHHRTDHITILTTQAFGDFLTAANVADKIIIDKRPGSMDLFGWLNLRLLLRKGLFDRVYDLQTSSRSNRYARLFWPGPYPEWSGILQGCSHPHSNPKRDDMHTLERQAEQLTAAGIMTVSAPDLSSLTNDIAHLGLPSSYCMIVPGGAQHRPEKRWSAARYQDVINRLDQGSVTPVLCGGPEEVSLCEQIIHGCQNARSIAGKTSLVDLVNVARGAKFALGNDNGPMHIAAVVNTRTIVLYSHASDPVLCAQRGQGVSIIRRESLDDLPVDDVWVEISRSGGS